MSISKCSQLSAFIALICGNAGADIIYVNQAATGTNTGQSWADAFSDLHDALAAAQAGDEIWVAAGRYKPDRGTADRFASFELQNGVALYGGFGSGESAREQRDWRNNKTILSGDLNSDDEHPNVAMSDCCEATFAPGCDNQACAEMIIESIDDFCAVHWHEFCQASAQMLCCDIWRLSHL